MPSSFNGDIHQSEIINKIMRFKEWSHLVTGTNYFKYGISL